jgi:hypothetical protein
MDPLLKNHLLRLRAATVSRMSRADLAQWIQDNTTINGEQFSFLNHEYQLRILQDESDELVIRKSAQTGISEISMRRALALLMIMPGAFRIGYTFPSATFAMTYSQSRLDPIIQGSESLKAAQSSQDLNSSEVKTFGPGKEIYFKGAAVGNAAISTTLDMLIHDELSFSDQSIIGDYWSRVLHSKYKWRTSLSTPTFVGDPIDTAFASSRRHWNFCKCVHCSYRFLPKYEMVVVPGFGSGEDLYTITKDNLHTVRYEEAYLACPKCGKAPDLSPEHREWVCENPLERHIATGFQVQPFDAPKIVTIPSLIVASTKYATRSKFTQFSLGLPATDSENGVTEKEVEDASISLEKTPFSSHVLGMDLGLVCHIVVGGVASDGTIVVVHYERVPLAKVRKRYGELSTEYNITIKVSDIQPYSELVMALSELDWRLYAARYTQRQGIEIYDMRMQDPDMESALEGVREVVVNRNGLFDKLLSLFRALEGEEPRIRIRKTEDYALLKEHVTSMKRASATLRNGEVVNVWQKPNNGNDHYFHALGYMWLAAQLRGVQSGYGNAAMLGVRRFRVNEKQALTTARR